MSENGGYMSGMGRPGERQTGTIDAKSQAGLPAIQSGERVGVDYGTFLMAILFGFTLGGIGIWIALSALAFVYTDYVTERLGKIARNARIAALIYSAEMWFPWLVLFAGLPLLRLVLPYQWDFDFVSRQHYLTILRDTTWEGIDPETLQAVVYSGTDNKLLHFPLLLRGLIAGIPVVWALTAGPLRRRLNSEIEAPFPASAEKYSEVGTDVRKWGQREQATATHTVRLETLVRGNAENVGKAVVYPGDQIVHENISATRSQWETATRYSYRDKFPTEDQATNDGVFSQSEWRAFRGGLVAGKLAEPAGSGDHGANAGYQFTDAGLDFFRNKRWEKRR